MDTKIVNIFTDLHHADLYYSLVLLLEKRMGFNLYRPIGLEWFHEGYWKIAEPYNNSLDTVNQFLKITDCPYFNRNDSHRNDKIFFQNDTYYIYDDTHGFFNKAITLDTFKSMNFDIIMPTYSLHDFLYEKLRNKYHPDAKLISHLGNVGQTSHLPNVIYSSPYISNSNQNTVMIHQELDINHYKYTCPNPLTKNIYSVVNCAPYLDIYQKYKNSLLEYTFKYYGAGSPDGNLPGTNGVSKKMMEANMGWCLKPLGGLGHSNMGWMYSGRPVVTNMSQHIMFGGEDAKRLFEPDVTCIDIDSGTVEENCEKIKRWIEPENNLKFGENARKRFLEIVNYENEEVMFRKFLENLK